MRFLSLFTAALIAISPCYVNGFCIYNEHSDDTSVYISQTDGYGGKSSARFSQDHIRANETQCCHYSNTDCNKSGKPDEIVKFLVRRIAGDGSDLEHYEVTCPGGGYIMFRGTKEASIIVVKWADGRDFPYLINDKPLNKDEFPHLSRRHHQVSYEAETSDFYKNTKPEHHGDGGKKAPTTTTLTRQPTPRSSSNKKRRIVARQII